MFVWLGNDQAIGYNAAWLIGMSAGAPDRIICMHLAWVLQVQTNSLLNPGLYSSLRTLSPQ